MLSIKKPSKAMEEPLAKAIARSRERYLKEISKAWGKRFEHYSKPRCAK